VRTSSPRRKPDRPIESVELRVSFQSDRTTASAIRKLFPSAALKKGVCEIELAGETPGEVADKVKELLEFAKTAKSPKAFK